MCLCEFEALKVVSSLSGHPAEFHSEGKQPRRPTVKREKNIQVAIMTPTLPQLRPDLGNQLLLRLHPGFPVLSRTSDVRTQRSARSEHFRWSGTELATCVYTYLVDTAPEEAYTLQCEPARLLRFKGTLWNRVRAFKGKWNRSVFICTQLLIIGLHFIRSIMIQQIRAMSCIQRQWDNKALERQGIVPLFCFGFLSSDDLLYNTDTRKWPLRRFPSCKATGSAQ